MDEIKALLNDLQVWFAGKPYGWRETATPGQVRQWEDRVREEQALLRRLNRMEELS